MSADTITAGTPRGGRHRRVARAVGALLLVAAGTVVPVAAMPAAAAVNAADSPAWLQRLNAYRAAYGSPPVVISEALSERAMSHSNGEAFAFLHAPAGSPAGAYPTHRFQPVTEDGTPNPYYVDQDLEGITNSQITMSSSGEGAVQVMLGAPFHLRGLLHPQVTSIGFAVDSLVGKYASFLAPMDLDRTGPDSFYAFPGAGHPVDVLRYSGAETPNPLALCPGISDSAAGLPLFAHHPTHHNIEDVSATITFQTADGVTHPLPACAYSPNQLGTAHQESSGDVYVIPAARLATNATYAVTVRATDSDTSEDVEFSWSFDTVDTELTAVTTAVDAALPWTAMIVYSRVEQLWPSNAYVGPSNRGVTGTLYVDSRPAGTVNWSERASHVISMGQMQTFTASLLGTPGSTTEFRTRFVGLYGQTATSAVTSASVPSKPSPPPPPPIQVDPEPPIADDGAPGSLTALAVSGSPVTAGGSVTVTGRLTSAAPTAGQPVRLHLRPAAAPSSRVLLGSARTSATGSFRLTGKVPFAGRLEVDHPTSNAITATTAQAPAIKVHARISWAADGSSATGRTAAIPVTVLPADARRVDLQRLDNGRWRTIASAITSRGAATFRPAFTARGTATLRVVAATTASALTASSGMRRQHVR